jgi:hypothetical protein
VHYKDKLRVAVRVCGTEFEESEFESRQGQDFSPLYVVQTGSGTRSASYPMGTVAPLPGVKRPGSDADHSFPSSADVKKTWIYTSTLPYVFVGECLISQAQGQLPFTPTAIFYTLQHVTEAQSTLLQIINALAARQDYITHKFQYTYYIIITSYPL